MTDPSNDGATVAFVVLAAGAGTRWRGPGHKLSARLPGGASVFAASLGAAVRAARECSAAVIVIVGDQPIGPVPDGVDVVHNPQWRTGQRSSLLAGLARAEDLGAGAIVVGLADQPFVAPRSWIALAGSAASIAVATYGGARGHPVRLARHLWDEVRSLDSPPDEGLRLFIGLHPELAEEVPCEGSPSDIDTVEDLDRWT